jgi:hypothetical protein
MADRDVAHAADAEAADVLGGLLSLHRSCARARVWVFGCVSVRERVQDIRLRGNHGANNNCKHEPMLSSITLSASYTPV